MKLATLYRAYQSPPLGLLLSHLNPLHSLTTYFSQIHFNIILRLRLSLLSHILYSGFPTKILYAFLTFTSVLQVLPTSCSLV